MILIPCRIDLNHPMAEKICQDTLPFIGWVMIASGLVVFLLEMIRIDRGTIN